MARLRNSSALVAAAILIAGCAVKPSTAPPPFGISNGTTLTVTLIVNGQVFGVFAPNEGASPLADPRLPLPPLPWTVEARSSNGRLLTTMQVEPGQVFRTTSPDGAIQISGALARLDLSCGRLDIWAGEQVGGPAPGPGRPGDCNP